MLRMRPRAARRCGCAALAIRKGRASVGGEHRVPLLDGDVFERLGFEDAGVVDEEVELAELFDDRGDGLLDALGVAQIAADGQRVDVVGGERADGLFRLGLRAEVGDGDVRSAFGQGEGDGTADTLGRSGDEHGLSL